MEPKFKFINYADTINECQEKGIEGIDQQARFLSNEILKSSTKSISVLDFIDAETIRRDSDHFERFLHPAVVKHKSEFGTSLPLVLVNVDNERLNTIKSARQLAPKMIEERCLIPVIDEYGGLVAMLGSDEKTMELFKPFFQGDIAKRDENELFSSFEDPDLIKSNMWLFKKTNNSYYASFSEIELINNMIIHLVKDKLDAIRPGHFQLLSGKHVLDYISSNHLFAKPKYTSWFARIIYARFQEKPVDCIVTYSDQTLMLASELKSEFEKRGVTPECLSMVNYDNPRLSHDSPYYKKLKGKKALVVTDVTITGHLLSQIATSIKSEGGRIQGLAAVIEENTYNGPFKKLFYALSQYHIDLYDPADESVSCPGCKGPEKKPLQIINPRTNAPLSMPREVEDFGDIYSGYEQNRGFWEMVRNTDALKTHALFGKRHYYYYIDTFAILDKYIDIIEWRGALKYLYGDQKSPDVILFPENPSARKIASHIGANILPSASLVRADIKTDIYTTGDDSVLTDKDILIVDDGANTGDTLNGLINLCARNSKKSDRVKICIFVDRLVGEKRETLLQRIRGDNMQSIYTIPIPVFIDDRQNCPLCLEVAQLQKHYDLMSLEAKKYIDGRLEKIQEKEVAQDLTARTAARSRFHESTILRAKMLDFLFQRGDLAFLEALIQKTPIEKLFRVLDAIPPDYVRMKDIKEWLSSQLQDIKNGGQLTKFIRMWLNVAPEEIIRHLYYIVEQFASLKRNWFLAYMLEWLIYEDLISKDKVYSVLNDIFDKSPEHRDFIRGMLDSVIFKYPEEIRLHPTLIAIYDDIISKVAKQNVNVLITGESGTGKGILARIIHEKSKGGTKPYKIINVSSFSETLMESELFGHEKGAFTGAVCRKIGKLEAAAGGTAFFDEISQIPLHLQVKLLGVLDQKEFERVGGTEPLKPEFRLICATNKSLEELIKKGKFREDLFYRIDVVRIDIPPLRENPEDILILSRYFIEFFCKEHNIRNLKYNREEVEKLLVSYRWPGNVRELKNVIQRAVVLSDNGEAKFDNLRDKINSNMDKGSHLNGKTYTEKLNIARRGILTECLEKNHWNKSKTAKELDISWKSVNEQMKKLNIAKG
ncbi:MAG: sigma 54-interacting transcriptional regulator [Deltaproteobacteria bacterium]|nr:sigma 54-interacting transcriptional regulator [Deltaproteobacteria bacterium]